MAVHLHPDTPIRPLTVADVEAMVEARILGEDDKVELVGGVLVEKVTQSERHTYATVRLNQLFVLAGAPMDLVVVPQCPLDVRSDINLPEPDIAVVPSAAPHRRVGDALLVVEVSVSSLRLDLGYKARVYAAAGVPEYWVLDVDGRTLHVHTQPEGGAYSSVKPLGEESTASATALDLEVDIRTLLD